MTDVTRDTGLYSIEIEAISFSEEWGSDVSPLKSNTGMPIIVLERDNDYRLIDGWGRVSGLVNAGRDSVEAILVSEADLASKGNGDNDQWGEEMYVKYAPKYTYRCTTN